MKASQPVASAPPADAPVQFVHIAPRRMLAVDGDGIPGGDEFQAALGALYPVAYGLHFALRSRGVDARVGALEGLWWQPADLAPGAVQPRPADAGPWPWTLLLPIPVEATETEVAGAVAGARRKHPSAALDRLRIELLCEGDCAEVLHRGAYSAEGPTIARLHAAIDAAGRVARGRHHEIYLGDPRRCAPERLRTVIRQPVARVA
ncbi:MAG TPA: GyrI-like domain-containing protein [Candidatus Limnocylindrales bacterium]